MSIKATEYFSDFVHNIGLSQKSREALKKAHTDLRAKLEKDDDIKPILISTFIQGSYARSTGIKPLSGENVDVDVIAVTNMNRDDYSPQAAFEFFYPFMKENYGEVAPSTAEDAKVRQQNRSIGIKLANADVDFVPTAAPSEALLNAMQSFSRFKDFSVEGLNESREDSEIFESAFAKDNTWKDEPLLIPDYDDNEWDKTHPLEQIRQTREKNKRCNGYFLAVVKSIKWWKRVTLPDQKHPKSYPLERLVGECCPDDIGSVAEGIVCTFEAIVLNYRVKPFLPDYGVPTHDVFGRLSVDDYNEFYKKAKEFSSLARKAYDAPDMKTAIKLWREFFSDSKEFPEYDGPDATASAAGFTPRTDKTAAVPTARFG
ncbi:SMODS domain-containing nucleotidyltransferase [Pygmaiobacter massiliensis]|uniref:SMODS domain-containing nucleotidyltransferase n=1 Tax=Pygmaiobacter massiliensis TaxID=1917873 RepID=UPI002A83F0FA|nr:nucleotidyltransferase [Pygmaiobacter massiliensis]MDY4784377.1 nucleotidyltransferase [Pygmaiobacter massiliensis]